VVTLTLSLVTVLKSHKLVSTLSSDLESSGQARSPTSKRCRPIPGSVRKPLDDSLKLKVRTPPIRPPTDHARRLRGNEERGLHGTALWVEKGA
jgi:hypothetical protein